MTQVTSKLTAALHLVNRPVAGEPSHLELFLSIVLLPSLDGGLNSVDQLNHRQGKWLQSTLGDDRFAPVVINATLPTALHPLLLELRNLMHRCSALLADVSPIEMSPSHEFYCPVGSAKSCAV
ncbi:hypothetical protein PINS_up020682 [Pythium insidiosum]|nr:hypothetical protein PINS_up020682 [Pythium insidiosum]